MKVIESKDNLVKFSNGLCLIGEGEEDCCAINYLDFEQFNIGEEFPTMTAGQLIDNIKIKEDGFILKDSNGTPKWAQARSEQNGYYSNMTDLVVEYKGRSYRLGQLSGSVSWE